MHKPAVLAFSSFVFIASLQPALADSSNSNKDAATAMGATLSGTPGIGSAAPAVSGANPDIGTGRSASGWGNTGSAALSSGGQVSRGESRGNKGGNATGRDGPER